MIMGCWPETMRKIRKVYGKAATLQFSINLFFEPTVCVCFGGGLIETFQVPNMHMGHIQRRAVLRV